MNWKILIYLLLLLVAFILGILVSKMNLFSLGITGNVVSNSNLGGVSDESYTKAFCNSKNECVDLRISCFNEKVSGIEMLSDVTSFGEDWKDPRSSDIIGRLC